MSKQGQYNISGVDFQLRVALFYLLENFKYENFIKAVFEGDKFSDFTLFFKDSIKNRSFIHNIEVKKWNQNLSQSDIKELIKKEIKNRKEIYSVHQDRFLIIAPNCSQRVKTDIKEIKKHIPLHKDMKEKDLDFFKTIYQNNPILKIWKKEEILFLRYVELVELNEDQINNSILKHFRYEDSFYYRENDLESIQTLLLEKIKEKSKIGGYFNKEDVDEIIFKFRSSETNKSESYNLKKSLGDVIKNIETYFENEEKFKELNNDLYLTPISERRNAVFSIVKELKKSDFKLKSIKFFIDKILIKNCYFNSCMELLEKYIQDKESYEDILDIISKLSERNVQFDFYCYRIFEFLYKILIFHPKNDEVNDFTIQLLDQSVPDFNTEDIPFTFSYQSLRYKPVPKLISIIFKNQDNKRKYIDFIFEKFNFIKDTGDIRPIPNEIYCYITDFINSDFKKHFQIVIDKMYSQFQTVCKKKGVKYKGYKTSGVLLSGFGIQHKLHDLNILRLALRHCIDDFYNENPKNWDFLKQFIYEEKYPIFAKRCFIPFLLQQLESSHEAQREKFFKALNFILSLKEDLPRTEDVVMYEFYSNKHKLLDIPEKYLKCIIQNILYKYEKNKISYDIFLIQNLIYLVSNGKTSFEKNLKSIISDSKSRRSYIYEDILEILAKNMNSPNIQKFVLNLIDNQIIDLYELSKQPWSKGVYIYDFLNEIIKSHWKSNDTRGEEILKQCLHDDDKRSIKFIAHFIGNLSMETTSDKKVMVEKTLEFVQSILSDKIFLEKFKQSETLRESIAKAGEYAVNSGKIELAEKIIELCIKDRSSLDSNSIDSDLKLHNEIIEGKKASIIIGMRSFLCYAINAYLVKDFDEEEGEEVLKKREKVFNWVKILIDLSGSLSQEIPGFPKPSNYYLRCFAMHPLINLSLYPVRKSLNSLKDGLGDQIKQFAFDIIDQIDKDVESYKDKTFKPLYLFEEISLLFDKIRDLNETEAKKFLTFVLKHNIKGSDHLFIYYAIFRKEHFHEMGKFDSSYFEKLLENICKGEVNDLKKAIAFTIYKDIENKKNERDEKVDISSADFDSFEKVKKYWELLFDNFDKSMTFELSGTLSFLLSKKSYYTNYIGYFFKIVDKLLEKPNLDGIFEVSLLDWENILSAIGNNKPNHLAELLLKFLKEGDQIRSYLPFQYEVERYLIPKVKEYKNKISGENQKKIRGYSNQYHIPIF